MNGFITHSHHSHQIVAYIHKYIRDRERWCRDSASDSRQKAERALKMCLYRYIFEMECVISESLHVLRYGLEAISYKIDSLVTFTFKIFML